MPRFILNLLGPFQASLDERPVTAFSTDKVRALLVYLAVEGSQPQRREALSTLLWPDQPEERARHNLRQALSSLRQAVGDTTDTVDPLVLVERDTVQANLGTDFSLDVAEFVRLAEAIRRHLHHSPDRCLPCVRRYERQAALYRGDFLADFHVGDSELFEEWALLKREWLRRLVSEAFVTLAGYHERRGELVAARDYARQLVQLEPWREEAHRQLMRLLAAEGQRSAALAQYEACRRILQTEFDAQPAVETTRLFEQIKRETSEVRQQSSSLVSAFSQTSISFVGREAECSDLAELLADPHCRLVTLTGPGGVGKSRLALQVAEEQRGLFPDGVVFIPLSAVTHSDLVAQAIADALHLPATSRDVARYLLDQLHSRTLLLVLDNFEHLLDCCDFLSELLRAARGLKVLVTSQERLHLQEEWLYPLGGLSYPVDFANLTGAPETYSALALFQQRARQVLRHFAVNSETLPAVIRICQLVEGLPLGVELAAATVGEQSCAEIAAALERTFDALETPLRNVPSRHRSLRAAFEHAWALMSAEEQQCFLALAVFAGSFDREGAVFVASASPASLAALTAKSLLAFSGTRYLWHGAARQYALEHLEASARAEEFHTRHCAFFADRVRRSVALWDSARVQEALVILEPDRANLLTAWEWAVSQQHLPRLTDMTEGLGRLYRLRGPAREGLQLLAQALELPALKQDPWLESLLRAEQVQLLSLQLCFDEALESVAHLIALGERLSSPLVEGRGYLLKGQTLQQQGKFEAAQQALETGLEHIVAAPHSDAAVTCLNADVQRELGNIATRRGNQDTAQARYEVSLQLYRALGNRWGESSVLNNLGTLVCERGDYDAAQTYLLTALALYRELGNRPGEAKALNNLANVAADLHNYSTALQHYREALQIHQALGNQPAQSTVLNNLGALYWGLGLYAEAHEAFGQALAMFRASGNLQAEGESLANLSLLELCTGDLQVALRFGHQAVDASRRSDDAPNLANASTYLGKIYAALGQLDDAEHWYHQALTIRGEIPHAGRVLELHAELASLARRRGNLRQALEQLAPVLANLRTDGVLGGAEEPYQVYWICYEILRANADPRADSILAQARERLLDQASHIPEPELRRAFLENIPAHRRIAQG